MKTKKTNTSGFTTDARCDNMKDVATGRFANGWIALVWKQGRFIHAKLYDTSGTERMSQAVVYGPDHPFFAGYSFALADTTYTISVWGGTKTVKGG